MDESALTEAGEVGGDEAVGAALLMADLEAAITSAGDEIAVLRRVADASSQPPTPLPPVEAGVSEPSTAGEQLVLAADTGNAAPSAGLPTAETAAMPAPLPEPTEVQTSSSRSLGRQVSPSMTASLPGIERAIAPERAPLPMSMTTMTATAEEPRGGPTVGESRPAQLSSNMTLGSSAAPLPPSASTVVTERPSTSPVEMPAPSQAAPTLAKSPTPIDTVAFAPSFEMATERRFVEPDAERSVAPVVWAGAGRAASKAEPDGSPDRAPNRTAERGESAEQSAGGPTEGDVFLDGERVGRWLARHLSRELGGPAASAAGFDPRIGPAWPGALHGN